MSASYSRLIFLSLSLFAIFQTHSAIAQTSTVSSVKAVVLYNIARYSNWEIYTQTFTACFLYEGKMSKAMAELSGNLIQSIPLKVEILKSIDDDITPCQLLYIPDTDRHNINYSGLADRGILTASDKPAFLEHGGAIAVYQNGEKVAFSINRAVMKIANVTPSSRLLYLADEVR